MSKTLVIILSETRAHELTFNNFKTNVILIPCILDYLYI